VAVGAVRGGFGEGRLVGAHAAVEQSMATATGGLEDAVRRAPALARARRRDLGHATVAGQSALEAQVIRFKPGEALLRGNRLPTQGAHLYGRVGPPKSFPGAGTRGFGASAEVYGLHIELEPTTRIAFFPSTKTRGAWRHAKRPSPQSSRADSRRLAAQRTTWSRSKGSAVE
jgi:hypothetical protein